MKCKQQLNTVDNESNRMYYMSLRTYFSARSQGVGVGAVGRSVTLPATFRALTS